MFFSSDTALVYDLDGGDEDKLFVDSELGLIYPRQANEVTFLSDLCGQQCSVSWLREFLSTK